MISTSDFSPGVRQPNGSYTGMLGFVQRNEVDAALTMVRSDCIDGDSFYLGPAVASADALILGTAMVKAAEVQTQTTDIVDIAQPVVYMDLAVITILTIFLMASSQLVQQSRALLSNPRSR